MVFVDPTQLSTLQYNPITADRLCDTQKYCKKNQEKGKNRKKGNINWNSWDKQNTVQSI